MCRWEMGHYNGMDIGMALNEAFVLLYSEHIDWRLGNYERILWAGEPGGCLAMANIFVMIR